MAEEKPARWPRKQVLPNLSVKCLLLRGILQLVNLCCYIPGAGPWDPGPDGGNMLGGVPS